MNLCLTRLQHHGVHSARRVHYWGHYPVADLEFETDAPVHVGLRAWAPFLPGDITSSMLPGVVFEVHLRNPSPNRQQGAIALSFPGPLQQEAGTREFQRAGVQGALQGVAVTAPLVAAGGAMDLVGFIGNVVGALKVEIVGHRHPIDKATVIKSLTGLLK